MAECRAFKRIFQQELENGSMPMTSKIMKSQEDLPERTTAQIRSRLNNIVSGKQKCDL